MLHKCFIEVAPMQISSCRSYPGLQGIKVKRLNTFITEKEMALQAITVTRQLTCTEVTGHQGIKMHSRNAHFTIKKMEHASNTQVSRLTYHIYSSLQHDKTLPPTSLPLLSLASMPLREVHLHEECVDTLAIHWDTLLGGC